MEPSLNIKAPEETLVIAELSANHGGSLQRAIETIHAAAEAGAGAIKLQTYTPETMTLDCDRPEFVIRGGLWDGRTLYDLYGEAHTPWDWHSELFSAAEKLSVPIFSTPFDRTAVDLLETLSAPAYKIASFELTDIALIDYVAQQRKPIIMSTGMATLAEIGQSVAVIRDAWEGADYGLSLLKCVSAYPAQPEQMNLATIPHLGAAFGVTPGLSDHTLGSAVAVASIVLGARVIEKHFILDRAHGGPDSAFSMQPEELRQLVRDVRAAEQAIGAVHYGPTAEERPNATFRRSIFVTRDVRAGERITEKNVRVIRPGHGLPPAQLGSVLGRKFASNYQAGTPLTGDMLSLD